MTYIGITNDNYLEHHGVKGMKWGVHKTAWIPKNVDEWKTGLGRQSSKGTAIGYTIRNRKGKEKQRSAGLMPGEKKMLIRRGFINPDGSVTTDTQRRNLRTYMQRRKRAALAGLATIATIDSAIALNNVAKYRKQYGA